MATDNTEELLKKILYEQKTMRLMFELWRVEDNIRTYNQAFAKATAWGRGE